MKVTLPALHDGQKEVYESEARFKTVCSGRRWGKTRLAVVTALAKALQGERVWWVAPSYSQSEIAGRLIAKMLPSDLYERNKSKRLFEFPSGGEIWQKSADREDNLRGEGIAFAVLDEAAYISESVWTDVIRPALADSAGSALLISTPRAHSLSEDWFESAFHRGQSDDFSDWASWRFTSYDNPFIKDEEIDAARETTTEVSFRREFLARFEDDPESALWLRAWFDEHRVSEAPGLSSLVIAIDPAGGGKDEAGIVVAGKAERGYVLEDASGHYAQAGWADKAVELYHTYEADAIIAESNYGGDMVERVIRSIDPQISYRKVNATRGKAVRAEPVASLYKRGEISHVGTHTDLENELATWTPDSALSPGRLDAVVWAFYDLYDLDKANSSPSHRTISV